MTLRKKNKLFHLKSSPDSYQALTSDKNIKLFGELGIFNEREVHARRNVLLEAFATDIWIEVRTLLNMLQTRILPIAMEDVRVDAESGFASKLLNEKRNLVQALLDQTDKLSEAFDDFPEDTEDSASYSQEILKPLMVSARETADKLEGMVDNRLWPLPTYSEMLHGHQ
jgi:glutamine synthetase